ncbi:MAG: PCMD domain-containing protein [Muribaculaceae bacterium]|nr:PCMD domain-containing protein [Muribaculaceae bacterium]
MKIFKKLFYTSAVVLGVAMSLQSCVSESPFEEGRQGTLLLSAELRGDITKVQTRAEGASADYDVETLSNNLVVYIQKENVGVIRKFIGLESLQGTSVALQTGQYVIEGWTGDSVSASFDKKFYYGYQAIDVKEGNNTYSLKCDIANVIASVNTEKVTGMVKDLSFEIGHTKGKLLFTPEMIENDRKGEKKAYFMMPNGVKSLHYKIEGKSGDGTPFSKEGDIENALRAHDYQFVLKADPSEITQGGALIDLEIVEVPTIDEEVVVFPGPTYKAWMNNEKLNINDQLINTSGNLSEVSVRVLAYGGLKNLKLSLSDNFSSVLSLNGKDLVGNNEALAALKAKGIRTNLEPGDYVAVGSEEPVKVDEFWFTFTPEFLNSLPSSPEEYVFGFDAVDGRDLAGKASLRIANSESAIEVQPSVGPAPLPNEENEPMAILATSATLRGYILKDDAANYGIMYREKGTADWTKVGATSTTPASRANYLGVYEVKLINLKPGTTYEYKCYADGYEDQVVNTFVTETPFIIPDASFEDWSTYKASTMLGTKTVTLPGSTGNKLSSYWGSGNEGAATANMTLTDKSSDMIHSGTYSACLKSKSAMGMIAAGNIFVGHYVETEGTNGKLSLGREYNGSHPKSLKVYANYRPGGNVTVKDGNQEFIEDMVKGGTDQGQIYVALTTGTYEIRTNPDNRKLFDKEDSSVLAYGQVTWKEAFGPDGSLQPVEIQLEYNERAQTKKPTHLVIVCSASKFGDYFCGSSSSVMYLDDFELIY